MAIQPLPAHGTLNWDVPLNAILRKLGNQWFPDDYGWLSWTIDPSQASTADVAMTSGTVFTMAVWLRQAATVSNIVTFVNNTATLTAGQNFAGLYDSAGTRVGVTADQSASWASAGLKTMALTAPASVTAGMYYIAMLCVGATPIIVPRESNLSNATFLNAGLSVATSRIASGPTAQTSLPTSITLSTRTQIGTSFFGAVS